MLTPNLFFTKRRWYIIIGKIHDRGITGICLNTEMDSWKGAGMYQNVPKGAAEDTDTGA